MCSASRMWLHQEWLSPVQMPPYRCIPMQAEREYIKMRLSGSSRSRKPRLPHGSCYNQKKIMYLVVPHTPLFGVVVEQLIIVFVVGKFCHHAGKSTEAGNIQVLLAVFLNLSKGLFSVFLLRRR